MRIEIFVTNSKICKSKGTIDLFKCSGSPMFASLPHFFLTDPKLLEGIESGLNPSKEKHGITMLVEIVSIHIDVLLNALSCSFLNIHSEFSNLESSN